MLRGFAENDWNPKHMLKYDMWTVLWKAVTKKAGVNGIVACIDKRQECPPAPSGYVDDGFVVICTKDIDSLASSASVIFHRGGFKEFHDIVYRHNKPAIYYGAGKRREASHELYKLVLNDKMWVKPAVDSDDMFVPMSIAKSFDVCYIANHAQREIKSIDWVYKTAPEHLRVLHIGRGCYNVGSHPKNVTVIESDREHMPYWINNCLIGIVPYWSGVDSAPRVVSEMQACGLYLVVADTVHFSGKVYGVISDKEKFWNKVESSLIRDDVKNGTIFSNVRYWYERNSSMSKAAFTLLDLIQRSVCELDG